MKYLGGNHKVYKLLSNNSIIKIMERRGRIKGEGKKRAEEKDSRHHRTVYVNGI